MTSLKEKIIKEFEKVANGLFLHGKKTPEKSYNLPKGQYTIADAVEHFSKALDTYREETIEEIVKKMISLIKEPDNPLKIINNYERMLKFLSHLKGGK